MSSSGGNLRNFTLKLRILEDQQDLNILIKKSMCTLEESNAEEMRNLGDYFSESCSFYSIFLCFFSRNFGETVI